MTKIISLTKQRGFIFPSSEIYGGFASCYDFGPLGVELKNNIKKAWWKEMTMKQENVVGLDAAILMSPKVWQASGHLTAGFADELVECKKCHHRFRKDFLEKDSCPDCKGELTEPKKFNLMMKTFVGPIEDENSMAYLRAETCQGIYMNFKNVLNSSRQKVPFGIAQIGKAFRNEITPGNFIFRTREFEQMEMQWFCHPKEADKFFDYWREERMKWYLDLGVKKENLRFREVEKEELAHYARRANDIEYKFPFGWKEIEGIHNRGDWDLSNHSKNSGEDLKYFDEESGEKYFPHIIETSAGADRSFLAFLSDAFCEIKGGRTETTESTKEAEYVLKINKSLAPIKVAVLPLVKNKPDLVKKAKEIYQMIKSEFFCQYEEAGSIGRRYRRQDEAGTMFCITVDFETLEKGDVTIRDRDTMKQERIKVSELKETLKQKFNV
ncbi:MAG: glycine--tRNA ligase [Candidatus Nealsonbacteria bacterium]|nr:glycine--tRNA ligase [Candidatus Nealsonbacteria bacterium]